jgi:hypothetical protein
MRASEAKTFKARLDRVEAKRQKADTGSAVELLPRWRYERPRIYNHTQLLELAAEPGQVGAVARGLLRIRRYSDRAKVIEFDAETELIRTLASLYQDPLTWVIFNFDWGREPAMSLVPLPEYLQVAYDVEFGPDGWAADSLFDLGQEVAARPFDRISAVPAVRMATASGHGIGKTVLQSWLALWALSTRERCRGVATSTTAAQLGTRLWPELQTWLKRSLVAHWFETFTGRANLRVHHKDHPETWRFDGATASADNSEAFAGLHNASSSTVFLLDEASGIDARIWRAIEGSMVDGAPLLIATGNPLRRDGEFFRVFSEQAHRWSLRHVDSRQAHLTNKTQIAEWVADWGEDSDFVKVRVRGLFPSASLSQFIGADLVDAARQREAQHHLLQEGAVVGVDVARFGGDASTIATRVGRDARSIPMKILRGLDVRQVAMETARHANELRTLYGIQKVLICVDGVGIGAGVCDLLRASNFEVVDVQAAGRARDDRKHSNVRAMLWSDLRDWLGNGGLLPQHDEELAEELTAPDFLFDTKGRIQIEKKDTIRTRLGRSPDRADALALTFAVDMRTMLLEDLLEGGNGGEQAREAVLTYDPLAAWERTGR